MLLLVLYAALALAAGRTAPSLFVRLGSWIQGTALALCAVDVVRVLSSGTALTLELPFKGPFAPHLLRLDPLSAVFVAALVLVGGAIALYAPSYLDKAGHRMSGTALQAVLALLEASILDVVLATDLVGFFLAWELMTALATVVVLADGHRPEVKRAAILYIVITHIGTFSALGGLLLLLGDAPSFSFEALKAAAAQRPPLLYGVGVSLALVGFGTKAGVVPLHVWLPEAHPVAPSHVSALLSGVIIKVGVYAMVRTVLDLAGPPPSWVGYALLVVGLTSALLGVLYALAQHDLKRLLAFHSVENIGIILLGVGLGICAQNAGLPALASVAMAAGLFHVINHAVFKGLLFLCAGSVHLGTHTHDLEEMGGLIKKMPSTARSFHIAALALSALPPLNGFASEWLVLQGCIASSHAP
ncbi:MAG: proton-conducting transporter transmembrane domain-containing protein, partial [Myxococcaceae bacterium]